jgi:hypothetical protein
MMPAQKLPANFRVEVEDGVATVLLDVPGAGDALFLRAVQLFVLCIRHSAQWSGI